MARGPQGGRAQGRRWRPRDRHGVGRGRRRRRAAAPRLAPRLPLPCEAASAPLVYRAHRFALAEAEPVPVRTLASKGKAASARIASPHRHLADQGPRPATACTSRALVPRQRTTEPRAGRGQQGGGRAKEGGEANSSTANGGAFACLLRVSVGQRRPPPWTRPPSSRLDDGRVRVLPGASTASPRWPLPQPLPVPPLPRPRAPYRSSGHAPRTGSRKAGSAVFAAGAWGPTRPRGSRCLGGPIADCNEPPDG